MISKILKNLSILKKFLFINFLIFLIISILTVIYVRSIQPSLIKNKSTNHFKIIDNKHTIDFLLLEYKQNATYSSGKERKNHNREFGCYNYKP